MLDELEVCDALYDDDGNALDVSKYSFKKLAKLYDSVVDASYLIEKFEAPEQETLHLLDYRPSGMEHGCLGAFSTIELAKKAAILAMRKELRSKVELDDKLVMEKFKKKVRLHSHTFFITEMKVDSNFHHLTWIGEDGEETIQAPHQKFDWYTVIKGFE